MFASEHAQSLPLDTVTEALHKDYPDARFSRMEIDSALNTMQEDNQIMVSDKQIFLI